MLFYDKETLGLNNYCDVDELQCSDAIICENCLHFFLFERFEKFIVYHNLVSEGRKILFIILVYLFYSEYRLK